MESAPNRLEAFAPKPRTRIGEVDTFSETEVFSWSIVDFLKLLRSTNTVWIIESPLTRWETLWIECRIPLPCITFFRVNHITCITQCRCVRHKRSNRKFGILKGRTTHTRETVNLSYSFTCVSVLCLSKRTSTRRTNRSYFCTVYSDFVLSQTISLVEINHGQVTCYRYSLNWSATT